MEFEKLNAPSLRELFVQQLEHMILSGNLKVGEKLPPERQLAAAMQVSRAVVNSGISDLERKGFLIVKPRVGTFVADYRRNGNLETLISIMNYNGGRMRDDEIRSILEVRIALDSLASRRCIERATDHELNHLHDLLDGIRSASNYHEAANAAFVFQHELALLSGNTLIPLIFHSFQVPVLTLWERFCSLYGIKLLYENTYRHWSYLQKRDADGALNWIEHSMSESISGRLNIYY